MVDVIRKIFVKLTLRIIERLAVGEGVIN